MHNGEIQFVSQNSDLTWSGRSALEVPGQIWFMSVHSPWRSKYR